MCRDCSAQCSFAVWPRKSEFSYIRVFTSLLHYRYITRFMYRLVSYFLIDFYTQGYIICWFYVSLTFRLNNRLRWDQMKNIIDFSGRIFELLTFLKWCMLWITDQMLIIDLSVFYVLWIQVSWKQQLKRTCCRNRDHGGHTVRPPLGGLMGNR